MNIVYLSLGSNLGNRSKSLGNALKLLEDHNEIVKVSRIYETEAWGNKDQPNFLNQAAEIRTTLGPDDLLENIHFIEMHCGRTRGLIKYAPRIIDVDILFYNSLIRVTDKLIVPHPLIQQRLFVLVPMAEIAPGFIHPVSGKTIRELIIDCKDQSSISLYH